MALVREKTEPDGCRPRETTQIERGRCKEGGGVGVGWRNEGWRGEG